MTLAFFSPPIRPADERLRQAAVDASGVLAMTDRADLQRLVAQAAALFDAPMAALSILDGDRQVFIARIGLEGRQTSRAVSFCGYSVLTPQSPFVVPDAQLDARFAGNPLVLSGPEIRFYAGAPLIGRAQMPLGALCVLDRTSRATPDPAALAALAALGAEAIAAIYARDDSRNTA